MDLCAPLEKAVMDKQLQCLTSIIDHKKALVQAICIREKVGWSPGGRMEEHQNCLKSWIYRKEWTVPELCDAFEKEVYQQCLKIGFELHKRDPFQNYLFGRQKTELFEDWLKSERQRGWLRW